MKLSERYSLESLATNKTDPQGRLFAGDFGFVDLAPVEIVGASVDTIRQLFYGLPIPELIERLECYAKAGESIFTFTDVIGAQKWHFTRMGKIARYRYKLQSNDEGVVILFGSFFNKMDKPGQHLKIELSPHFISQHSVEKIWQRLHGDFGFSRFFLEEPEAKGCAIHLACDYQGFTLPSDFIYKFSTYSRTVRAYDGLNNIDLSDISEAIATYGGNDLAKNYLIGKASSTQFCLYDKGYEIIKSDKVDYFQREWNVYSLGLYDPDKVVRRIEARLHHQVLREIGIGMGKEFESFVDIAPFLTDIWRYALSKNRLNFDDEHKILHPFWQLLMEDVHFYVPAKGLQLCRKKKESVSPIGKNIGLALGNMITIYARQHMTVKQVMQQLRLLTFYPELLSYYRQRNLTESDLRQYVEKSLCLRHLVGKAA